MSDDQKIEEELQDLSLSLDSATVLLKNKFKHLKEQERAHVQALKEGEELRSNLESQILELKEQKLEHAQELEKSRQSLKEQALLLSGLTSTRASIHPEKADSEIQIWLSGVRLFVASFIAPVLNDENRARKALVAAKNPEYGMIFIQALQNDPGLRVAASVDITNIKVAEACIIRWLMRGIFEEGLRGVSLEAFELLEDMEQSMQQDVKNHVITLNALRAWRAKAYFAWLQTPQYKSDRQRRTLYLTTRLATGLSMFLDEGSHWDAISQIIHDDIVEPGLALKEQMVATKHDYQVFLDTNPLSETPKVDFEREEYLDITDNHRQVKNITLSGPNPTKILGVISTGCTFTKLQLDDSWGGSHVVSKQQRLVARAEEMDRIVSEKESKDELSFFSRLVSQSADIIATSAS
ncbi:hypothetical protein PG985_000841 [Apiospora marii]|uniref:Uncharacterized protein n=1 Tax=Apiospora marii TaxID=335849 RepID=A0ABR1RG71_9PEZI